MGSYKKKGLRFDKYNASKVIHKGKKGYILESGELPSVLYYVISIKDMETMEKILKGGSIQRGDILLVISKYENCSEFADPKKRVASGKVAFKISNGVSEVDTYTIKEYYGEIAEKIMEHYNCKLEKNFIDTPHKCVSRIFRNNNITHVVLNNINKKDSIPGVTNEIEKLKINSIKDEEKTSYIRFRTGPSDDLCI